MLELCSLTCVRGRRTLFRDLKCSVAAGHLLHVQGANGSGKTSLLRILCGLLAPASGAVLWRGAAIGSLAEEFGRDLVYIGHAAALKDDLSAMENLGVACQLGGLSVTLAQLRAALQRAGLGGTLRVPARHLSQGQRRRAVLARLALALHTPLWVLDEPFNALDASASAWLRELIGAHLACSGIVVWTSHQDAGLERVADSQVIAL